MPYTHLENLSRHLPSMRPHFHRMMGREIVRERNMMLWLNGMRTEQRLAAFLLNMSQRFNVRGYSASEFNLRMTREEIGSYLGMKHETVSRLFSRFQDEGLISVKQRLVQLCNISGLKALMSKGFH